MITTSAPLCFRCATSSSECARAMIGSVGVQRARLGDDLAALEGVGDRDQQPARRADVGGFQHVGRRGVAGESGDAVAVQPRHLVGIVLDHREDRRRAAQRGADRRADPAVADQHHMAAVLRIGGRRPRHGGFRRRQPRRRRRATKRSSSANSSGLSMIETIAPASTRSRPRSGNSSSATPRLTRMKENSPICASEAEIVSAVRGRMAEQPDDGEGRQRLAEHDDQHGDQAAAADRG